MPLCESVPVCRMIPEGFLGRLGPLSCIVPTRFLGRLLR